MSIQGPPVPSAVVSPARPSAPESLPLARPASTPGLFRSDSPPSPPPACPSAPASGSHPGRPRLPGTPSHPSAPAPPPCRNPTPLSLSPNPTVFVAPSPHVPRPPSSPAWCSQLSDFSTSFFLLMTPPTVHHRLRASCNLWLLAKAAIWTTGIQSARTPAQQAAAVAHRNPLPSNITALKLPRHRKYTNPVAKLPRPGLRLCPDVVHKSLVSMTQVKWTPKKTEFFVKALVDECRAGNRPQKTLNRIGKANVVRRMSDYTQSDWH
ncbi:hypothetical protein BS78_01G249800 [Paspalum vaginatum]|nr:hypothetical protein BS78_01G249800 [Paspalum vaginatum]